MAMIKIQGKTKFTGKTVFDTGYSVKDSDAAAYIAAVEVADEATLEDPVKEAIDTFVLGCKSDGIWSSLKAACIMAGARTLNGALVPLVGTAPTNFNFVSADYNRKTGLTGNGSTKYIDTYVAGNSSLLPLESVHASIYATTGPSSASKGIYIGNGSVTNVGSLSLMRSAGSNTAFDVTAFHQTGYSRQLLTLNAIDWVGFKGVVRDNSTQVKTRNKNVSYTYSAPVGTRRTFTVTVFRANGTATYGDGTYSFYSIGESLDLALLDTRVSTLMSDIAAAI